MNDGNFLGIICGVCGSCGGCEAKGTSMRTNYAIEQEFLARDFFDVINDELFFSGHNYS
jgi:hypothetical protein